MIRYILFFLLTGFCFSAQAQKGTATTASKTATQTAVQTATKGMEFFHGTWEEAQAKAAKEGKFLVVDGFTTWCGPCRRMSSITFKDEKVGKFYNKHFINYKLDMEKGEGPTFRRKYGVRGYPTVIYFDSATKELSRFSGYRNPLQFLAEGKKIVADPVKLQAMTDRYEAGERDTKFLKDYIQMLQYGRKQSAHVAKDYLKKVKTKDLKSDENMALAFDAIGDIESPFYKVVFADLPSYEEKFGKEEFHTYVRDIGISHFLKAEENKDAALFTKSEELIKKIDIKEKDLLLFKINMRFQHKMKNWPKYKEAAVSYLDNNVVRDVAMLNNIAWNMLNNFDDKEDMLLAEKWSKKSVQLKADFHNCDTYAHILSKLGKKEEAVKYATKAIDFAKKARINHASTTELLEKLSN